MDIIELHQNEFKKIIDFLKNDIQSIRTNRANVEMVAKILIEVYGTKTPLEQLATMSVPEPKTILIQTWDRNIVKEVEKALTLANLGVTPTVSDGSIRLNFPPLNEETRKNLIKFLHVKTENARKSLRSLRDSIREEIIKAERQKQMAEDDKYRLFESLDKTTNKYQEEIKLVGEKKEAEIITI